MKDGRAGIPTVANSYGIPQLAENKALTEEERENSSSIRYYRGLEFGPGITNCWLPDFLSQTPSLPGWLINPLLPLGGTVFLHGDTSIGKSPLTWAIAASISEGLDFFGYPVQTPGPVLYLELDTPANLIHPRLSKLRIVPRRMFLAVFDHRLNILSPTPDDRQRLLTLGAEVQPVLVIINTLVKSHGADDKESSIPSMVYGAWRSFFPSSTILVVHHDRKLPVGTHLDESQTDQLFSGSKHWMDDAQVALHLRRSGKRKDGARTSVTLKMTKSQVSNHEDFLPITLELSEDGTNWLEVGPAAYRRFFSKLDSALPRAIRVSETMRHFGISQSTAYDAVRGML